MPPQSPEDVSNLIHENYADYLYYLDNVVTFDWLKEQFGQFPPERCSRPSCSSFFPTPIRKATTTRTPCSTPTGSGSRWTPRCPRALTSRAVCPCTRRGATPPASRSSTASRPPSTSTAPQPPFPTPISCGSSGPTSPGTRPSSTSPSVVVRPPAGRRSTSARTNPAAAPRWVPSSTISSTAPPSAGTSPTRAPCVCATASVSSPDSATASSPSGPRIGSRTPGSSESTGTSGTPRTSSSRRPSPARSTSPTVSTAWWCSRSTR